VSNEVFMNMAEAQRMTGYTDRSIREFIKRGDFAATMPRGTKGGWHIVRQTFENWWAEKNARTANRHTVPQRARRAA
jgi:hypothetical protein